MKSTNVFEITSNNFETIFLGKKNVLFLPASIRSHIVPTLHVAKILSKKYEIFYAVTNTTLSEIVTKNGYKSIIQKSFRFGVGMERNFLASNKVNLGFINLIKSMVHNDIYKCRAEELDDIIKKTTPATIFIDVYNSTDFLVLYKYRNSIKLLFYNPMLSTYKVQNWPTVSENFFINNTEKYNKKDRYNKFKNIISSPKKTIYEICSEIQWKKVQKLIKLEKKHKLINTPFTHLFENVHELILAPLELEFSPVIKRSNQYYLGLCIEENRNDTELDKNFNMRWSKLIEKKKQGYKLIYCSFGTFFDGSNKLLLNFINNLLQAIKYIPKVQLVCSVNKYVIEVLESYTDVDNLYCFERVPQLEVLKETDVHITHGGLGSIKESIFHKVPMIVYPLDLQYDQNGNALKVEYHGLGMRGVFSRENSDMMRDKIVRTLTDKSFKDKISKFKNFFDQTYNTEFVEQQLNEIIKL